MNLLYFYVMVMICQSYVVFGSPCTVGMTAPNQVTAFDGTVHTLEGETPRYLLAAFTALPDSQCKFEVTLDMEPDSSYGRQVSWITVSQGVHGANSDKFDRRFRISRTDGMAEIRGRGFNRPVEVVQGCYHTDWSPTYWTFCLTQPDPGVMHVVGTVPLYGCSYLVTYEEPGAGSNLSPHAWVTVETSSSYDDLLDGLCGNRDGKI